MAKAFRRMTAQELFDRRVRLRRELRNKGGQVFAAGSIATIVGKFRGVEIRQDDPPNWPKFIKRVSFADLELLPVGGGHDG